MRTPIFKNAGIMVGRDAIISTMGRQETNEQTGGPLDIIGDGNYIRTA
jgi:hypothetical protein